jgi:hypothetical protein
MVFRLTGNFTVAKQMPGNMGFQTDVITESVPELPFYLAYKADESTTRYVLVYLIGRQHQQSSATWQAKTNKTIL